MRALACVVLFLVAAAAWAEEPASASSRAARLAEEFSDPLTTLPQVFLKDEYIPTSYGTEAQANRVVARLIVPRVPRFSLLPFVQLIRPTSRW